MAEVCEDTFPVALNVLMPGTRLKVLRELSAEPRVSLSITELIDRLQSGRGAVQREVARLVGCGLLCSTEDRRGRQYALNVADPLAQALLPFLNERLAGDAAPVDVPKAEARAPRQFSDRFRFCAVVDDVDAASTVAVVVGEAVDEAYLQRWLGDTCATRLFSPDEFLCRLREGAPLLERAVHGPHHALIRPGDRVEFGETQEPH